MPRTKRRLESGRGTVNKTRGYISAVDGAFGKVDGAFGKGKVQNEAQSSGAAEPALAAPGERPLPPRPCRRCAALLPATEFERDGRTKDGRATCCRPCQQVVRDRRFAPESRRTQAAQDKPPRGCRRCNAPFQGGHHNAAFCSPVCRRAHQQETQRVRAAAFHQAHRARRQAAKKAWMLAHPEKVREQRQRAYQKHRERERAACRAWIAANRNRYNRMVRDYRQRQAAIAEGKEKFAKEKFAAGLFLLIRARSGFWRADAPGQLIGQTERIVARYECLLDHWAAFAPVVADLGVRRVAARLALSEEKRRHKAVIAEGKEKAAAGGNSDRLVSQTDKQGEAE